MDTLIGKSITSNWMMVTEQLAQILLPTNEIGGYLSIKNTLRDDTANWMDPTIQKTIIHFKQATGPGPTVTGTTPHQDFE